MHAIDLAIVTVITSGALYGIFAGPIVTLTTLLGFLLAGPLLYFVHPYFFNWFPVLQQETLAHLLFFPIGYLLLMFSLKATALKFDSITKGLWWGGKRLWGLIVGAILSSIVCVLILSVAYTLFKEVYNKSFPGSKFWYVTEVCLTNSPRFYLWLGESLNVSSLKLAVQRISHSVDTISGGTGIDANGSELLDNAVESEKEMNQIIAGQQSKMNNQQLLIRLFQKLLSADAQSLASSTISGDHKDFTP